MSAWVLCLGLAWARDPWGPIEPETPPSQPSDDPWGKGTVPPPSDDPWGNGASAPTPTPSDPGNTPPPATSPAVGSAAPTPSATRPVQVVPTGGGQVPWGVRIDEVGGTSSVRVRQQLLTGADGGTHATELRARWVRDRGALAVAVPFATYATPTERREALGNLQLGASWRLADGPVTTSLGLEGWFRVGGAAWTWVNAGHELWPGGGADLVVRGRADGDWTWLFEGSLGYALFERYAPFPGGTLRAQLAGGFDRSLTDALGVTGELAAAYWDPSPLDLTALFRADPTDGLRARAGVVLPLATWAGWTPADQPAGAREATVLLDLSLAL